MKRKVIALIALLYLVAVVFGLWGFAVGGYQVFPYDLLHPYYAQLRDFLKGGQGQDKSLVEKLTTHVQQSHSRFDYGGFVLRDPAFRDPGYVLVSRFSDAHDQAIVELVRADGFTVLHRWVPPIREIYEAGGRAEDLENLGERRQSFTALHPLLMPDGSVVCSHGGGILTRIDRDSRVMWADAAHFHHSIERDADGNLVAMVYDGTDIPGFEPRVREEPVLVLSPEGERLARYPIGAILIDNGYAALLAGISDITWPEVLHLNDAQPVLEDNGIARRGDLILSLRRISSIALFRPSENRIVRLRTGPWIKQHDANLLDDGTISVFDNNAYMNYKGGFKMWGDFSAVCVWDPVADTVGEPWQGAIEQAAMRSRTEGRSRVLPNGDVFIEETEHHRLLRLSPDAIRWEYVNADPADPDISGAVHWCRYYLPGEIDLTWLEGTP